MDPISDKKFDELYRQCESLTQHEQTLQSLKLKVKKLKKAGKLKLKHLPGSLTSHDQDWLSGLSTDGSSSVCDGFEPKVDDMEMGDDTKITYMYKEEEVCMQQGAVDSEEDTEEVTLLDKGIIDDTSACRENLSSAHIHRHELLPSKTNRTLKRRLKEPQEQLPQSANKDLPLFCDPAEHFGGVWQSIVVEKDERPI